jgi:FkbM family methyltransferase
MRDNSISEGTRKTLKTFSEGLTSILGKVFYNPYRRAGISWFSHRYLKYFSKGDIKVHKLYGRETFFYNTAEYFHGIQEIFAEEIYKQQLPANAVIIDCGAHIGMSVIYLKRICPSANITAFEPDARNFRLLEKNITAHELQNVSLRNEAVWTENTTIRFAQEGTMSSKIEEGNKFDGIPVKATRLKDLINAPVDFLKLDIEGAEFQVLKDMDDKLLQVKRMFVEYHGSVDEHDKLMELCTLFTRYGFQFYIKEATPISHPFLIESKKSGYDVQLNIFCFRKNQQ